jgi:N-glycosylase/DNA lyase
MLIPYSTDVEEYHKITIKYLKYINKSIIKHIVNATALYCEKSKNIKTTYYKKQKHIEHITNKYKEYLNKCEQENNFAETISRLYNLIKPFYSIKKNEFVQLCKTKVVTKS